LEIEFSLDDQPFTCREGLSVVGALFHVGRRAARFSPRINAPRLLLCGMGLCFDCVMEIDGRSGTRACMTLVRAGVPVVTQRGVTRLATPR